MKRAFKSPYHGFCHYLNCMAEAYEGSEHDDQCIDGAMDYENFHCFMADQIANCDESMTDAEIDAEIAEIAAIGRRMIPGAFAEQ